MSVTEVRITCQNYVITDSAIELIDGGKIEDPCWVGIRAFINWVDYYILGKHAYDIQGNRVKSGYLC